MMNRRTLLASGMAAFWHSAARAEDGEPKPRRFMMADVNGVIVTDENLLGRFGLIFFGYMSCPDICPTALMTVADVLKQLGPDAEKVLPLFVTVDPDRDTPARMAEFTAAFDPRIVGLRGPKAYVDSMVEAYGAQYEVHVPDPKQPEYYTIDHTASIMLTGPDGRLIRKLGHDMTSEAIVTAMRKAFADFPLQ